MVFFVRAIYFPLFEIYRFSVVFKQLPDTNGRKKNANGKNCKFSGSGLRTFLEMDSAMSVHRVCTRRRGTKSGGRINR